MTILFIFLVWRAATLVEDTNVALWKRLLGLLAFLILLPPLLVASAVAAALEALERKLP